MSINSDNQLVLQNLSSRTYGERLSEVLSKYETATVQEENKLCPNTICIGFENYIWENWSSTQACRENQMKGRRVMVETIKFLEKEGYRLVINFKIKKKTDCFFFERRSDDSSAPTDRFVISFWDEYKMAIVGDPLKSEPASVRLHLISSFTEAIFWVVM